MIQKLILRIASLLVKTLAGKLSNVKQRIRATTPASINAADLPLFVLTSGNFTISQQPGAGTSTEPRPTEFRQTVAVNASTPQGPYGLAKTPLKGSLQCKVIFDAGKLSERQVWLEEGSDFTINYSTKQSTFSYDLTSASSLLFIYSYVSVFTLRDFAQELFIDVYGAAAADVEQWASLIAGSIITYHDDLIESCNQSATFKTQYNSGGMSTLHQLHRIQLFEGSLDYTPVLKTRLKFMAYGQIKATREITDGFGLIESIHSPGRSSTEPVDIVIGVE